MQSPKDFLDSIGGTLIKVNGVPVATLPALYEAMRLYASHVAKEIRHTAAEIAMDEDKTVDEIHRDIMNLKIK